MAANDVLSHLNAFVDGRGYAGEIDEWTPPKLTTKTEDYRAGGMDSSIPLDMGMDKLECSFTMISQSANVQTQFGLTDGADVALTFRASLKSFDGTVKPMVYTMRGRMREIDEGTQKGGDKPAITYTMDLKYYKKSIDGVVTHEIDVPGMKRFINGVDQLAAQRAAIGL